MTPELHRPVALDRLGPGGAEHRIEASEAERAAIAARLQIPAVLALECRFALRRAGTRVDAEGRLRARVVRECVVSLEPFETEIGEDFRLRFVPPGAESDDDPLSIDEVPFSHDAADLGEAAVQQLALALDPFPRKPGAALPESGADEAVAHPFAALSRLRGSA